MQAELGYCIGYYLLLYIYILYHTRYLHIYIYTNICICHDIRICFCMLHHYVIHICIFAYLHIHIYIYIYHRIGWWDNLQESPTNLMVLVKTMVSCRFSQQNQSIDFNMSGFFQRATSLTGRGDLATFAAPWWAEGARAGRNSNLINWSKANSHWNWNLAFFFIPNQFSKKYPRMYPRMHQKVI